jgi:hypothetical protein
VAAYNFGPGNVAAGRAYPKETRDYVTKVAHVPGGENAAAKGPAGEEITEPMQTSTQANPEPIKAAVPAMRGINNAKGPDRDQFFAALDGQMARDAAMERAIKAYDEKGDLSLTELQTRNKLLHARRTLLQKMAKDRDDEEYGPLYEQWYQARYNPQPEGPSPDEGPGFLGKVFKGIKDTGSMAVQHPFRSLANVGHGVEERRLYARPRHSRALTDGREGRIPYSHRPSAGCGNVLVELLPRILRPASSKAVWGQR